MRSKGLLLVLQLVVAVAPIQLTRTAGSTTAARVLAGPPSSWSLKLSPARSPNTNVLNSISCSASARCVAVGYFTQGSVKQTLTEVLKGQGLTVIPSPDVGSSDNVLKSVSCPASNLCEAVGFSTSASGASQTLVESWNGTSWSVESSPNPSASGDSLAGVACSSAQSCQAVGRYEPSSGGTATIAEAWNGDTWEVEPSPSPGGTGGISSLAGVSCTGADLCVAVGSYSMESSSHTLALAESWNGHIWSLQSVPQVTGTSDFLRGVSCMSESAFLCAAVGYESTSSSEQTFIAAWNGKGTMWTHVSSPDLGRSLNQLNAVSCAARTFCISVGFYSNGESKRDLAEVFNGSQWTVSTSVSEGQGDNVSNGVNCPKPRVIDISVGSYIDSPPRAGPASSGGSAADQTLVESFNGKTWIVAASPDKGDGDNGLKAISCVNSSFCMAVGSYDRVNSYRDRTLIEFWDGVQWSIVPSPNDTQYMNVLDSVSCVNTRFCVAVGTIGNENHRLIETWNGSAWAVTPNPGGADTSLSGVSCTTIDFCIAVGSGPSGTLAESWNGSTWSLQVTVNRGRYANLGGVSCVSPSFCMGVGAYEPRNGTHPLETLAESWNGSKWLVTPTGNPGTRFGADSLTGVSCITSTNCVTVGVHQYEILSQPIIDRWNGTNWAVSAGAKLPWVTASLVSVTCYSRTDCVAVGYHLHRFKEAYRTLIESWNGLSWTLNPSPNIGNSNYVSYDDLNGVACPKASYCLAVGSFFKRSLQAEQNLVLSGT